MPLFAKPLLKEKKRYIVLYGGRGSGKSYTIADSFILKALMQKCIILCAREYQKAIKYSVYSLLLRRIEVNGLSSFFTHTKDEIISHNGSKFIFSGLKHNIESIRSIDGINYMWIEEANNLSKETWHTIRPTIREENSQIWISFNPKNENDIVYDHFINTIQKDAYVKKINYNDNTFFPDVLEKERRNDEKTLDRDLYAHIWLGECLKVSDSQIFRGKFYVEDFEPDYYHGDPIYGLDFGFSQDPTVAVEVYIKKNVLYIRREACKIGLELDKTVDFILENIPKINKYTIRADSARPESISYLKRHGFPLITAVQKGAGSVEDGIAFMRSFDKIVIHVSCLTTINEFNYYSYKTDLRTGDITHMIIDKYNHAIDAIRYALRPFMKSKEIDYGAIL